MEIQKIFSNVENPKETLYSVLMTEDEVALFSEMKDDLEAAGAGAGAAIGLGAGAYGAGKAAGVISKKLKANRKVALGDARIAGEKARNEYLVNTGLAAGNKNYEKAAKESEKLMNKYYKRQNRLAKEGSVEKGTRIVSKNAAAAQKWIKAHPGKASAIAAGTLAAGAGLGFGAKKLKDHRKGE